jgi:hypothetical protein
MFKVIAADLLGQTILFVSTLQSADGWNHCTSPGNSDFFMNIFFARLAWSCVLSSFIMLPACMLRRHSADGFGYGQLFYWLCSSRSNID